MRPSGRAAHELRQVTLEPGYAPSAEGSCLVRFGNTHVLCAATVQDRVPFLRNTGRGWVTAEYGMLPRSTDKRTDREAVRGRQSGRTMEIQRLIGRALRAVTELDAMGERQIVLDCDVLRADGGTRTAAITGAYVALHKAFAGLVAAGELPRLPLREPVAAVSGGLVEGQAVLDLDFAEDSAAEADANFVLTGSGAIVEIQVTAEATPLTADQFVAMHRLAVAGVRQLVRLQRQVLGLDPWSIGPSLHRAAPGPGQPQPRQARRAADAARAPWRGDHLEPRAGPAGAGGDRALPSPHNAASRACGGAGEWPPALADDRPRGTRSGRRRASIRRAGPGRSATFAKAMARVRDELSRRFGRSPAPTASAAFVAVLCLAWPDGHEELAEGRVEGELVDPPRGSRGFGYDPMFVPKGYQTFGEMAPADKHQLSHRARALRRLVAMCFGPS